MKLRTLDVNELDTLLGSKTSKTLQRKRNLGKIFNEFLKLGVDAAELIVEETDDSCSYYTLSGDKSVRKVSLSYNFVHKTIDELGFAHMIRVSNKGGKLWLIRKDI